MFDFQSEALARISAAAPELSAHVLSFQDLSQELPEGTTYSVGLITLGAPAGLFYVPAVAYGMVVQPFDSLIDAMTGNFMPFSNIYIQKALTPQANSYGKATRIPKYVATNPSIYNLVVPPRTGKVAYASEDATLEMIRGLPKSVRMVLMAQVKKDPEVGTAIGNAFDIQKFLEALNHEATAPTVSIANPEVQIITDNFAGKNLEHAQIQEILNNGYTVVGDNITPRMAIPMENATDKFSKLSGCREGTATTIVMKDGTRLLAMLPKQARKAGEIKVTHLPAKGWGTDNIPPQPDGQVIAIGTDGSYITDAHAVVAGEELEMSEAVKELYNSGRIIPLSQVNNGEIFMLVTDTGAVGPMMAGQVYKNGNETQITAMFDYMVFSSCERRNITCTPAYKGTLFMDKSQILVSPAANAIVLSRCANGDVETHITSAWNRQQLHTMGLLEGKLVVKSLKGPFTINGQTAENEAEAARSLIIDIGLSKAAALNALAAAKEFGEAKYHLSKSASFNQTYDDIPAYGNPAMEQPPLIDNFDNKAIIEAGETADPEVMGGVIISQFMNNPNVFEMVSAYVPQLNECVDKLGRTILLLRLNTDAEKAATIMNLLTSTRNTYRLLGDTAEKLGRMVNGHAQAE